MITTTRAQWAPQFLPPAITLLGMLMATTLAHAASAPTTHPITIDGFFTNAAEWSDVVPTKTGGSGGVPETSTYFTVDLNRTSADLLYDPVGSTTDYGAGLLGRGLVSFTVGADHYEVTFFGSTAITCAKNNASFLCDLAHIKGAQTFGVSRNSSTPHNAFELSVQFDCQDPTLIPQCPPVPGVYSPAPSHWGAAFPRGPISPTPQCVEALSTTCGAGLPRQVPCGTPGSIQIFGDFVSNNCVNVIPGTGGTFVNTNTFPASAALPALPPGGIAALVACLMLAGATALRHRQRQAAARG
jgi:hypothetical protein